MFYGAYTLVSWNVMPKLMIHLFRTISNLIVDNEVSPVNIKSRSHIGPWEIRKESITSKRAQLLQTPLLLDIEGNYPIY